MSRHQVVKPEERKSRHNDFQVLEERGPVDLIKGIALAAKGELDSWKIYHPEVSDGDSIVLLFFNKNLIFIYEPQSNYRT